MDNTTTREKKYQVISSADQDTDGGLCMLLYSVPGAGKTTLVGTLADSEYGGPMVIIDAEGGAKVLRHRRDISVVPIFDINENGAVGFGWEVIQAVSRDIARGEFRCHDGQKPRTVVYDNMSEIISIVTKHVLRTVSRKIDLVDRPDQNDWGKVTSEILTFVRRMRDYGRKSGTNIIFIGWELSDKNENGFVIKNGVAFNPALARAIPGIVDWVGFLRVIDGRTRERV